MIQNHSWNTSFKPLLWGFFISLILTVAAYFVVVEHLLAGETLAIVVLGLAFVQGVVQLILYLHLGIEEKPRWTLMIFLFMVLIMVVIIGGSLWIMSNLDYNLMENMTHSKSSF